MLPFYLARMPQPVLLSDVGKVLIDFDFSVAARRLAEKAYGLRVFEPRHGAPTGSTARELSAAELGLPLLVISQFTLFASTQKGNRPSYLRAARPEVAIPKYEAFVARLAAELGRPVATGEFGADMQVALVNDGPVTITMDTKARE